MTDNQPETRIKTPDIPSASESTPYDEIKKSMKRDPAGKSISCLGYDGVLRIFDEERNVIDAVGLNPRQIREYYDGFPMHDRIRTADGRNVSEWDLWHPAVESIPRKPTEEDKAKMLAWNAEVGKGGVACTNEPRELDKNGLPTPRQLPDGYPVFTKEA